MARRSAYRGMGDAKRRAYNMLVMGDETLRVDYVRRLRNAVAALIDLDEGWLLWLWWHVPVDASTEAAMRLVERRAKTLFIEQHHWTMDSWAKNRIIEGDRCFREDGVLV